jgi:hypothetical protein
VGAGSTGGGAGGSAALVSAGAAIADGGSATGRGSGGSTDGGGGGGPEADGASGMPTAPGCVGAGDGDEDGEDGGADGAAGTPGDDTAGADATDPGAGWGVAAGRAAAGRDAFSWARRRVLAGSTGSFEAVRTKSSTTERSFRKCRNWTPGARVKVTEVPPGAAVARNPAARSPSRRAIGPISISAACAKRRVTSRPDISTS